MKTYLKSLALLIVAAFVLTSVPAHAVSVDFLYQVPGDGSGKTSLYVDSNNVANNSLGIFIETFDGVAPAGNGTYPLFNGGSVTVESGGWFTSLNEATDLYVSGNFGIRTGTTSYAATPAGDTTNFAFAPGNGGPLPTTVRVEYGNDPNFIGYRINYLGLYYGSIDNYNNIAFYSGDNLFIGDGILSDGVITGAEILASQGGTSGNQFQPGSNVYVNLYFDPSEVFTAFELRTTGVAFEVDNIVIAVSPVPEPASMLLLGLGLLGLAGIRRKLK
ncbi:MAG: hypothetical protein CVU54_00075 [Deltaproteobacteria bacterium HGW-Deltaproteobacteria-12]|jgi:hypothetical protein|nr:MAG: hypothetical protein CVU54_00075 [Deltaproteobacteria bacterium HGW-Deltaproteobacteria-12]